MRILSPRAPRTGETRLLDFRPVTPLLLIPWFRAEPWHVPLPFTLPVFNVDHIPIQPFGIMVAIGVLSGARLAEWMAKRIGMIQGLVADYITYVVVSGFLGAYLLNALFYEPHVWLDILDEPSLFFKRYLGLSSYGGFIGVIVGSLIWKWRRSYPVLPVADAAAFGFPLGWMFGRTGCFIVHDHPGKVTDFFLAVDGYRVGAPPFSPRHDLGLYEVFWSIGATALFFLFARKKRPAGFYVAMLPILYTPIRFFLDDLRAGAGSGGDVRYAGFTPGQYASVGLFLFGVGLWAFIRKNPEPVLPPPPELGTPPAKAKAPKNAKRA